MVFYFKYFIKYTPIMPQHAKPELDPNSDQIRFCNLLHIALRWIQWYPGKLMIAGGAAVWMKQQKLTPALIWRIASGVDRPTDCSWLPEDVDVWCNGVIEVPGLRRPEGDTTICHPLNHEERMPAFADMPVGSGLYDRLARSHDIDTDYGMIQFLRVPAGWNSETILAAFDLPVCRVGYTFGYHRSDDGPFYRLGEVPCRSEHTNYSSLHNAVALGEFITNAKNMQSRVAKYRQRGFAVDVDVMIDVMGHDAATAFKHFKYNYFF